MLLGVVTAACGQTGADDGAAGSTSGGSSSSGGDSTGSTGTVGVPTTSAGDTTVTATSVGETGTTEAAPSTSGETSTSGGEGSSTGDDMTGETGGTDGGCDPDAVLDAVSFNYVKTVDVGVAGVTAGYYNVAANELVFLTASGEGVRLELDGTMIGAVEAPPMVSGGLDGAVYVPGEDTALLIDEDCNLAEVDPVTLAEISVEAIDAVQFDVAQCSGIALGPGGDLYVASLGTDEVVVISRDLTDEVDRFDVGSKGISVIDGISLIAGSENFLIVSGAMPAAGIFTATGEIVAPAAEIGGGMAPLVGGVMPSIPDGLFGACVNGQVWLCAGLQSSDCYKYAPEGGGESLCECLLAR